MFSTVFDPNALSREEFDYYFLDTNMYYCGYILEPHDPHEVESTEMGSYNVYTCNGNPDYGFPIEKECGS